MATATGRLGPGNLLLARLPATDLQRFLAGCRHVDLTMGEVLAEPGERIAYLYFPVGSVIALTSASSKGTPLQVGLLGSEGMLGSSLVLGMSSAPLQALVQGDGMALRMPVARFRRELRQSGALDGILKRYLFVLMSQLAQTAVCSRFHQVEARLARWLLMTHDRARADGFHGTQAFLACMLGVRRVGVTKAAGDLQLRKLISYRRGHITILDRGGLEATACGCYALDSTTYTRIMGRAR